MSVSKYFYFKWFTILLCIYSFSCSIKYDYDIILRDGLIIDGSGSPGYNADIGIANGKIKTIGIISGKAKIDLSVQGKVIAPGFIDTHSHHDEGMFDKTDMAGALTQGITTIFVGQDGSSEHPISKLINRLNDNPVAINVGSYSGHNTLREIVMGSDFKREATNKEIQKMDDLLVSDLEQGAWGLSSGLEYDPGIYSNMDEIISLAKTASKYGARYISHIRSEDRYFWSAVEEIITIGKKADIPVQISHIKLAMGSLLGKTKKLLDRLDQARKDGIKISADIYPYMYWQSTMQVLFPERDFGNKTAADFALSEITTPDGVIISEYTPNPKYEGMVLNEVATMRGQDPSQTLMDMIAATLEKDQSESIIAKSMREEDIIVLLNWEHTNLCTDGGSTGGHPRGYGSYPKVLGQYVREKKYLTIEQAIHKMTAIPANNMGLKGRGKLALDMAADMVVFDPITVQDRATFNSPKLVSKGILHVLVSGKFVLKNKKITRNRPGIFLNRVKQRTEG